MQVNLGAGGGQGQKIQVMDMDVAINMRLGMLRLEDKQLVELLGALTAVFEHRPHRGIGVNIGRSPV